MTVRTAHALAAFATLPTAACRLDFTEPAEPPTELRVDLRVQQLDQWMVDLRAGLNPVVVGHEVVDGRFGYNGLELEPSDDARGTLRWKDSRLLDLPLPELIELLSPRLEHMSARLPFDLATGPRISLADDEVGPGEDLVLGVDLAALQDVPVDSAEWEIRVQTSDYSFLTIWRVMGLPPPELRLSRSLLGEVGGRSVSLDVDVWLPPLVDASGTLRVVRRLHFKFGALIEVR